MRQADSFNDRQYSRMLALVSNYRLDPKNFGGLVNNLEGLIEILENVPSEWRDALRAEWGVLEEVYAVMLDEARTLFDEHDERLVKRSVSNLQSMIERSLGKNSASGSEQA